MLKLYLDFPLPDRDLWAFGGSDIQYYILPDTPTLASYFLQAKQLLRIMRHSQLMQSWLLVSSSVCWFQYVVESKPLITPSLGFLTTPRPSRLQTKKKFRKIRGGGGATRATPTSTSPEPPTKTTISSNTGSLNYNASSVDPGSIPIGELFEQLGTSPSTGLTEEEAQKRLQQYGKNVLEQAKSKSVWALILEQFQDRLVQILLVVAVLSGVFSFFEMRQSAGDEALWKSFVEPLVILAILILNAAVGVWQSQSASDSLDALQMLQPTFATILRDGLSKSERDAAEIVPGDILEIRVGDKIPADSRLLSLKSSSFQVDEGSLTGESVTVGKFPGDEGKVDLDRPLQDQKGMLYSGTMVTSGSGTALVVQTGMDTQFGKVRVWSYSVRNLCLVVADDIHT